MGVSQLPACGFIAAGSSAEVVWHELECGAYRADLPLWRELAERCGGPVLDIGAGSGRVTLELARAGHVVTALDRSRELLAALGRRAGGLAIECVPADARAFALSQGDYALCIVPMQTIQLLEGRAGRLEFLHCARAHLRAGGVLGCAILGAVEPFDCSDGSIGPERERTTVEGRQFSSRAVRVSETPDSVVIERERQILPASCTTPAWPASGHHEHSARAIETNVVELDKVTAATLQGEAEEVGLRAEPTREVAATDEHVGSSVVMLRA
jgi:Methyltransferase domain